MRRVLLSVTIFIISNNFIKSQSPFCFTSSNFNNLLQNVTPLQTPSSNYLIRIAIHVIRKGNGTGGISLDQVNTCINFLQQAYNPHGICFSLNHLDEVWDDYFYNYANLGAMKATHFVANAVNIYIGDTLQWNQGQADAIPSKAFLVGGNLYGSNLPFSYVMAHEMGHCLGLFHTFHGFCESGSCFENPDGSNCLNCGDYVCDTPADPQAFQINQTPNGCVWNGNSTCLAPLPLNSYSPDPYNIMAYTPPSCMQYLTTGQANRIKLYLANSNVLQPVIVPNNYNLLFISLGGNQIILYDVINRLTLKDVTTYVTFPGKIIFRAGEEIIVEGESNLTEENELYIDTICNVTSEINNAKIKSSDLKFLNSVKYISIFPNPTSQSIRVVSEGANILRVRICNLLSQCMITQSFSNAVMQCEVNVSSLSEGIYLVHIETNQGVHTEKLIIQR